MSKIVIFILLFSFDANSNQASGDLTRRTQELINGKNGFCAIEPSHQVCRDQLGTPNPVCHTPPNQQAIRDLATHTQTCMAANQAFPGNTYFPVDCFFGLLCGSMPMGPGIRDSSNYAIEMIPQLENIIPGGCKGNKDSCVSSVVWQGLLNLAGLGEFAWKGVTWAASSTVGLVNSNAGAAIDAYSDSTLNSMKTWWNGTSEIEDQTSEILQAVSQSPVELVQEVDPSWAAKLTNGAISTVVTPFILLGGIVSSIAKEITENFGCQEWEPGSIPHSPGAKCIRPMESFACMDCATAVNMMCGTLGYFFAEIPAAGILGKAYKSWKTGTKMALNLSKSGTYKTAKFLQDAMQARVKNPVGYGQDFVNAARLTERADDVVKVFEDFAKKWMDLKVKSIGRSTEVLKNSLAWMSGGFTADVARRWALAQSNGVVGSVARKMNAVGDWAVERGVEANSVRREYFNLIEDYWVKSVGGELTRTVVHTTRAKVAWEQVLNSVKTAEQEIAKINEVLAKRLKDKEKFVGDPRQTARVDEQIRRAEAQIRAQEDKISKLRAQAAPLEKSYMAAREVSDYHHLSALDNREKSVNLIGAHTAYKLNLDDTIPAAQKAEILAPRLHDKWQAGFRWTPTQSREAYRRTLERELRTTTLPPDLAKLKRQDLERLDQLEHMPWYRQDYDGTWHEIANRSFDKLPKKYKDSNVNQANNLLGRISGYSPYFQKIDDVMTSGKGESGLERLTNFLKENPDLPVNDPIVKASAFELMEYKQRMERYVGGAGATAALETWRAWTRQGEEEATRAPPILQPVPVR